ncbi:uncharacterized protein [Amphiura filiformis]|uniref:uncharacterized protein n=1 Tax=Amphiura filiformis TaxID=82378 RepID=UPI003B20CCD1
MEIVHSGRIFTLLIVGLLLLTNIERIKSTKSEFCEDQRYTQECWAKYDYPQESGPKSCPSGWESHSDECYYVDTTRKTYSEAEQACLDKGATLTSMVHVDELNFHKDIAQREGVDLWIGVHKFDKGVLRWSDRADTSVLHYEINNWAHNEPNNDDEMCVHMRSNGEWNDANCDTEYGYICRMLLAKVCSIQNCAIEGSYYGTNGYYKVCEKCVGDYGAVKRYAPSSDARICKKQCAWPVTHQACWPGTCNDGSCTCHTGFSGTDCMKLESTADMHIISDYIAELAAGTEKQESRHTDNSDVYIGNDLKDVTTIKVEIKSTSFMYSLPASLTKPAYIESQTLGIVGASVSARFEERSPQIRLVGGTYNSGRLEVYYNGQWGTVCDDNFDQSKSATVACRQLGFPSGIVMPAGTFEIGSGQIWLDGVSCTGTESTLVGCTHNAWGSHNCGHNEDVGVVCPIGAEIRLVGGSSSAGRLEIYHNGQWGTVCDDVFEDGNAGATVACQQLGFESGVFESSNTYGHGSDPIWLDNVSCDGTESTLTECTHNTWGDNNCGHHEDAGVICSGTPAALSRRVEVRTCSDAGSSLAPKTSNVACAATLALNRQNTVINNNNFRNYRIKFSVQSTSGGVLKVIDMDKESGSSDRIMTRQYIGKTISRTNYFLFDLEDPYHCTGTDECKTQMLHISPSVTKSSDISVSSSGWSDRDSKISKFELEVCEHEFDGNQLREKSSCHRRVHIGSLWQSITSPMSGNATGRGYIKTLVLGRRLTNKNNQHLKWSGALISVTMGTYSYIGLVISLAFMLLHCISHAGVYSFILTVDDNAGNYKKTRRFLFYDNGSSISTNSSAAITYDQDFGLRNRMEIPNSNGITSFRVEFSVFRPLLGIVTDSSSNLPGTTTQVSENFNFEDGDRLTFTITARDFVDNVKREPVDIFVDSSPPVISDLWLVRDGMHLAVHYSHNLHDMRADFEVVDTHSGISTLHWQLYDNSTSTVQIIADANIPVVQKAQCSDDTCYYILKNNECFTKLHNIAFPDGSLVHDHDYFLTVTATNKAGLSSAQTLKIQIDTTPPTAGVVHDGKAGSPEVDFQQSRDLWANWKFIDKESRIQFYRVWVGTECVSDVENSVQTISTSLLVMPSQLTEVGKKYYVTVTAYNTALQPSLPICSDGVVIDDSPPLISAIDIERGVVTPGLIRVAGATDVWFVNARRKRCKIFNAKEQCLQNSKETLVQELELIPLMAERNDSICTDTDVGNCDKLSSFQSSIYLAVDKNLVITWEGEDPESKIFKYEVGLSSDAANIIPDLGQFDTHSHSSYTIHHPALSHGMIVFLTVQAINNAQLSSTKVVGPLMIDLTPPEFMGQIRLSAEMDDLIVDFRRQDFLDDEDAVLQFHVAIGHSEQSTETLMFKDIDSYTVEECYTDSTCVIIPMMSLEWGIHANHFYYASIKATNHVGLSVVATSNQYRHIQQLPSEGVVLEVSIDQNNGNEFSGPTDIDVQTSTTSIAATWYGFEHPHQYVTYRVAVGSTPGGDFVTNGFVDVGNATSFQQSGLSLEYFQIYYVTVEAMTNVGSVNVTSDGVKVLQENSSLSGVEIYDGVKCSNMSQDLPQSTIHHEKIFYPECEENRDFQMSTSFAEGYWSIPEAMSPFITHALWSLEQETEKDVGDVVQKQWETIIDFQDLGLATHHKEADLFLQPGGHYRSKIRLCHLTVCFHDIASDGFWVISSPPSAGVIKTESVDDLAEGTEIRIAFQPFAQTEIRKSIGTMITFVYEWGLVEDIGMKKHFVSQWQTVDGTIESVEWVRFKAFFPHQLSRLSCYQIALRCINQVGLSATIFPDIRDCDAIKQQQIVIDAYPEITLEKYSMWTKPDRDYTPSSSIISAVWSSLRNQQYKWAIIEDTQSFDYAGLRILPNDPCEHPMALKCGETEDNFINIKDLNLSHGKRYIVCIHGDATTIKHEKWTENVDTISACSDGVVVDTTPPIAGNVWIGWNNDNIYQISTSEVVVQWDSFVDVEEHARSPHHSGIKHYEIAIGSSPGGNDIQAYILVGITNSAIIRNLRLQNGHRYYATVRATDFVGLSTHSTSPAITVDTTPPLIIPGNVSIGGNFIRSTNHVSAIWRSIFSDLESNIAYYLWAIGSQPGHSDIRKFTKSITAAANTEPGELLKLHEGHGYYITIKAVNRVGLSSLQTFGAFKVESSPPIAGHVYDGNVTLTDQDFQVNTKVIYASWEGFHDAHTGVIGYTWRVGSCAGCDDVLPDRDVGYTTDISHNNFNLVPGLVYYVTVTACNAADLCSSVSSDGILLDDTPPSRGHVYDGHPGGMDIDYQASRALISAHWWGFHDSQSQLSHFEWRVGTTQGGADILATKRIHLAESTLVSVTDPLPLNRTMYVTVRAVNRAGLWSESISNGFKVDDTPPELEEFPRIDTSRGVILNGTQVMRSVVSILWKFYDPESSIGSQYVSILSNHNDDVDMIPVKIGGTESQYTFTNLFLHDGSEYTVGVMACNEARLCTPFHTFNFTMDSSPPSVGIFATRNDHTTGLESHLDGWMTWAKEDNICVLNLAWFGFNDVHSGISHYFLRVGSEFNAGDLTDVTPLLVDHDPTAPTTVQGALQRVQVNLITSCDSQSQVYVTIWAVNGVGLQSARVAATFDLSLQLGSNSGPLMLIRRCSANSCEGHCVCASHVCKPPVGRSCSINSLSDIQVVDVLNLSPDVTNDVAETDDVDFIPTQNMMAAVWKVVSDGGMSVQWFEWSVGIHASLDGLPEGVFDTSKDRVWHDVGLQQKAIFLLSRDKPSLVSGRHYDFFVRAWYGADSYSVHRSDGVIVDSSPPSISTKRGARIKELKALNAAQDVDFMTDISPLIVSWGNVFTDGDNAISHYEVAIGIYPGAEDVVLFKDNTISSDTFHATFHDLSLDVGRRYFSSVRALNKAGLHTTHSSDGFAIDTIRPEKGIVYDGVGIHDLEFQNSTTVVSASWHGFVDFQSYIHHYEWCVGTTADPAEHTILDCVPVGLQISASKELATPLDTGLKIYSKVFAVDGVGLHSDIAVSDGVLIDDTPPVPVKQQFGNNLLANPSFEEIVEGATANSFNEMRGFRNILLKSWTSSPGTTTTPVFSDKGPAQDGNNFARIFGDISQTISTLGGKNYRILLYASHNNLIKDKFINQECRIQAPGLDDIFQLFMQDSAFVDGDSRDRTNILWQRHVFFFTASHDQSTITISSVGMSNGILLDNIQVQLVQDSEGQSNINYVDVGSQFVNEWSSFEAKWHFIDNESPIIDYTWAIGLVKGGTQLQEFKSVGTNSHAINSDLTLTHGSKVVVSVVAKNAVHLQTVAYSDAVVIDLTPPVITFINVETTRALQGMAYQSSEQFIVNWEASDEESDIENCKWAIGSTAGNNDIRDFASSNHSVNFIHDLGNNVTHGQRLYLTVTCTNKAGLMATQNSDAITILTRPPSATSATVNIHTQSVTQYPTRGYQAINDSIRVSWQGFDDPVGIFSYQCSIVASDTEVDWMTCGSTSERQVTLQRLLLRPSVMYKVLVKAVNQIGLTSEVAETNFAIETTTPVKLEPNIEGIWTTNTTLQLQWPGVFSSSSALVYEVSIGLAEGRSDILQWIETMETDLIITPLPRFTDYYVTLTSINAAGLYKTITHVVN